jgi:PAS domain S-box-containing protein
MIGEKRKTGIDVIGDAPWGTHLCQFYQTKEDLIDILVPYFKAGLESNEFCMWVTSEPLGEKEAKEAIRRAVPDFGRYLKRGQIEVIPHTEWYLKDGVFDLQRVLNGWIDKLNRALSKGYEGLRLTGNTAWLEKRDWRNFTQYEEEINNVIGKYRMLAICTYFLDRCGASEIIDVVSNHQFAVIRKGGKWQLIERSERRRMEEALKDSEDRYRSLVKNVKLGIFRSTPGATGKFLEVSSAMEEITGYSREELLQMDVSDLYVHPEKREAILAEITSVTGKTTRELPFRKKDGTEIVVSDTKVAVRDDAGKVLYFDGIIEDITEHKQAQEREKQLREELYLSRRLAAIGELAAGVAHEINNPLTGILGFSQRLLRKSTDEKLSRDLEVIHSEAQRVAKVVQNLLAFACRQEPRKQYADINDVLQGALELRAYELKSSNIEVDLGVASSLPKIMVDFRQIQEVFLNIILNAEQVMSEANGGGRLSIKTQRARDYIRISFADDGPGIPDEHFDKLFDPFFTTRGERGGTGLGLSICHGIVAEHGGKIYVKSKSGKGATFFVELPVTTEKSQLLTKVP